MKTLISILLLFCSFVSYSQTSFSDTLESLPNFSGERIILKLDNSFEYESWDCTGNAIGQGIYQINSNKLILLFSQPSNQINLDTISTCEIQNIDCDSTNKVNLNFKIVGNDNIPLVGAVIKLENTNQGVNSRKNGSAIIRNLDFNQNLSVKIIYVGYKTFKFNIFLDNCKFINIKMADEFITYVIKGEIKEFDISNKILDDECYYLENRNKTLFLINERY